MIVWNDVQRRQANDSLIPSAVNGIPILVILPEKNSLNNRFLPYDVIETRGVFICDDDIINLNVKKMEWGFRYELFILTSWLG